MIYVTPMSVVYNGYPVSRHYLPANEPVYYPSFRPDVSGYSQQYPTDLAIEQAAREYALARARVQTLRRQREHQYRLCEMQRQQYLDELRRADLLSRLSPVNTQFTPQPVMNFQQSPMSYRRCYLPDDSHCPCGGNACVTRDYVCPGNSALRSRQQNQPRLRASVPAQTLSQFGQKVCPRYFLFIFRKTLTRFQIAPSAQTQNVASLKTSLNHRLSTEQDEEMKQVVASLLSQLFGTAPSQPDRSDVHVKQDKGKAREAPAIPFPWAQIPAPGESKQKKAVHFDESTYSQQQRPDLHRTSTTSPTEDEIKGSLLHSQQQELSLKRIAGIRVMLQDLRASFVFPESLDAPLSSPSAASDDTDSESSVLPFTHRNKPVHAYEHALNGLMTQLDGIESNGDEEVRRKRREVVVEVEHALADVERMVLDATSLSEDKQEANASLPVDIDAPSNSQANVS